MKKRELRSNLSLGSMGRKTSVLEYMSLKIYAQVSLGLIFICLAHVSLGATSPTDVAAINNLHAALGMPVLPGWTSAGGDPCGEAWQGVQCVDSIILGIVLNGANLGGQLGENLGMFASILSIDLSNNHIGGSIPSNLPVCLRSLDLSSNNLCGQLPTSLGGLSTLTTLHLQNNQLSGTLDVLQDLPLSDLNIENNLFAGPIPEKLLGIPNFRKAGNPFNSSIAPVPPSTFPTTPLTPPAPLVPFRGIPTGKTPSRAPARNKSNSGKTKKFFTTERVAGLSIGGGVSLSVVSLLGLFVMQIRGRRREEADRISILLQIVPDKDNRESSPVQPEKVVCKCENPPMHQIVAYSWEWENSCIVM